MTTDNTVQKLIDKAVAFERSGTFDMAERTYKEAILAGPDDYIPYCRLGALLVNVGRSGEATRYFKKGLELNPDDPDVLFNTGLCYQSNKDFENAIETFEKAKAKGFDKGMVYGSIAEIYEQTNQLDKFAELMKPALDECPDDVFLIFNAAKIKRREKDYEGALQTLDTLLNKPDFGEVAMMVSFERGRNLEKLGKYDEAYKAFEAGNSLSIREFALPGMDKSIFLNKISDYRKLDLGSITLKKTGQPDPVFLIGFPRSGTTLLHQVLDGHPKVNVLEEEHFIASILGNLINRYGSLPAVFKETKEQEWQAIRDELSRVYQAKNPKGPGALTIDKLPFHIVDVPLILKIFPGAKFILAMRHPFDCTLSCFMQNFNLNNAMLNFTNLNDATRAYEQVFSLWQRYEKELKPDVLTIRYEDVVDNLDGEAHRALDFLSLDWDENVLNYRARAKARGMINTPSYHQVVQPIYKDAKGRWKNFEKYFAPYRERLVPFCKTFGYEL